MKKYNKQIKRYKNYIYNTYTNFYKSLYLRFDNKNRI